MNGIEENCEGGCRIPAPPPPPIVAVRDEEEDLCDRRDDDDEYLLSCPCAREIEADVRRRVESLPDPLLHEDGRPEPDNET